MRRPRALLASLAVLACLCAAAVAVAQQAGSPGGDVTHGGAGADAIAGGLGDDSLAGGGGDDVLSGGSGDDFLDGGPGVDRITGDPGRDTVKGGPDRDFLSGDSGDDALDGEGGSNVIDGGAGNDSIRGGDLVDSLNGGADDDRIFGGGGDDGISGASGRDHLFGGDGDDRIEGGLGQDLISAGAGNDNVVAIDGQPDLVRCGPGRDIVRADGGDTVRSDCERVIARPGSFGKRPDTRRRPAQDPASIGAGGERRMAGPGPGPGCADGRTGERLDGSPAGDTLDSTLAEDCLHGHDGEDRLSGGPNADLLDGGAGTDVLDGGSDRDVLLGGTARDFLEGGPGPDRLDGGAGSNIANGAIGDDELRGGPPADSLNGGSDEDRILGGAGDDGITGASGDDVLFGEGGADRIEGGLGADRIFGGAGGDNIVAADAMTDEIVCGSGSDVVRADDEDKVDDDCELLIARRGSRYVEVPVGERRPAFGVADQQASTFSDPRFRALGVRRTRLVVAWDAIHRHPRDVARWLEAAHAAGAQPLVAFNHTAGHRCPDDPCRAPSVSAYRTAFRRFRERFPWVTLISPWNEANHQTQPIARNPRRAAQYYDVVRAECRGCDIVAVDVLDQRNMVPYVRDFLRHAGGRPRIFGMHNYDDVNRTNTSGIRDLLGVLRSEAGRGRAARGHEVWLTETGGIVRFETADGRVIFPYDEQRAADRLRYLFSLANRFRERVRQVYVYQWRRTNRNDRFDAGLVDFDGTPRESYHVLRSRSLYLR